MFRTVLACIFAGGHWLSGSFCMGAAGIAVDFIWCDWVQLSVEHPGIERTRETGRTRLVSQKSKERQEVEKMTKKYRVLLFLFCVLLLNACGYGTENQEVSTLVRPEESSETDRTSADNRITYEMNTLEEEQEELVRQYMECYYRSLSALETEALDDLFAESAVADQLMNQTVWDYIIGVRSMQKGDLRLIDYEYELELEELQTERDGTVRVNLKEHSIQRFAQSPDIETECFGTIHTFVLVEENERWKIKSHIQNDGAYQNLLGEYWGIDIDEIPESTEYFETRKEDLLKQAEEEMALRQSAASWNRPVMVDYPYDGELAAAYGVEWIGKRNPEWDDFTGKGGNCQNFVSQCLYAGGIPRDISGRATWSWTRQGSGMAEDERQEISWINVEAFREYASENRRYGLAAQIDMPYYAGAVGDVIQMGFPERWSHAVLISQVIYDEKSNVIDYLIHSNTADVKNFPASAYLLPCQSLTKIYGWNE